MFKFLNNLAYRITKDNWGFPWHIILAIILTRLTLFALFWLYPQAPPQIYGYAWIIVNVVGYSYEVYEKRKQGGSGRDFWQDTLGNNIGFFLGL